MDQLKKDNDGFRAFGSLEEIQSLKELHAELAEKQKAAQEELMKAHAETAGLEKICTDFKSKVETLAKAQEELEQAQKTLESLKLVKSTVIFY